MLVKRYIKHFIRTVIINRQWNEGLFEFLRATAVSAGSAERVLAMVILSVCPSVCHDPVPNQAPSEIEILGSTV